MKHEIRKAFDSVTCEKELQDKTMDFLRAERNKVRRPAFRSWRAAPVLAMLVLVVSLSLFRYLQLPIACVSIDINPSMELSLNRLGRVVSAEGYNADGQRVLSSLSLLGLNLNEAIDRILTSTAIQSYLTEDNKLIFTVAAQTRQTEEQLLAVIESNPLCQRNRGQGCHGNLAALEEAHAAGLSLGKYNAYLELSQYDSSITPEDCAEMTMAQIHACIREHTDADCENESSKEQEKTDSQKHEDSRHENDGRHHGGEHK